MLLAAISIVAFGGCHGIRNKPMRGLSQTAVAQERFNGAPGCDITGPCAGFTETNWTPLDSCSNWNTSYKDVPIQYETALPAPVQYEVTPHASVAPTDQNSFATTDDQVRQVSFSQPDETLQRDSGVNDEVYDYSIINPRQSDASLHESVATDSLVLEDYKRPLDEVSIEYLP